MGSQVLPVVYFIVVKVLPLLTGMRGQRSSHFCGCKSVCARYLLRYLHVAVMDSTALLVPDGMLISRRDFSRKHKV